MEGREEAVRRHEREVLDHLRLRLIEGGEETPLGYTMYRLLAEEVRSEAREGEKTVVVLFRLRGDQRRFGFRNWILVVGDPTMECQDTPRKSIYTTCSRG